MRTAPRVVTVVGAVRGIGRSTIALNVAVAVARQGRRVCLLDADGDAARESALASFADVVSGHARVGDALQAGPDGVDLLAFQRSGRRDAAAPCESALLAHVDALETRYDLIAVDAPGGLSGRARFFAAAASEVLVVATPQPAVVRQTETLVRVLAARCGRRHLLVVANLCDSEDEAVRTFDALAALATRPPHVRLSALGWIPTDSAMLQARRARSPIVGRGAATPAGDALTRVAVRLASLAPSRPTGGAQFFFETMIAQGRAA